MALLVKNPPANAEDVGDMGSIPGWKDPLEEEKETHYSIYSCLEKPLDRGAWRDIAHGVTDLDTTELT